MRPLNCIVSNIEATVFPPNFQIIWPVAAVIDRSCPKALALILYESSSLYKTSPFLLHLLRVGKAVILLGFSTSLHHFQTSDLPSPLLTYYSVSTASLPWIPMLPLPSTSLSSPPTLLPQTLISD